MVQEPEGSSPHSQQPATGPYPEPVKSNPHSPKPISLRSILIPSSRLHLGLPSGLFPLEKKCKYKDENRGCEIEWEEEFVLVQRNVIK
jgi:hypothetical protein